MIWVWVLLGVYLALLFGAVLISAFPPRVPVFFSPGSLGLPQEDASFQKGDGHTLRGWWIPAEGSDVVAVLVHGYLMNRSELSPLAVWLHARGISSLTFDLRAHGKSGGRKSGFGAKEASDVEAAVAYARSIRPGARIVLIGSSMGAAACAIAAGKNPGMAHALVLDCAYSRLWVATLGWWRFLGGRTLQVLFAPTVVLGPLVTGINPFAVDVAASLRKAGTIPILLLHGSADTLAPPFEAERNLAACQGAAKLVWLEGQGHAEGRWNLPDVYLGALEEFLAAVGLIP